MRRVALLLAALLGSAQAHAQSIAGNGGGGIGANAPVASSSGTPANANLLQVATRSRIGTSFAGGTPQLMATTTHYMRSPLTSLRIVVPNFYLSSGVETAPGGTCANTASIEYPVGTINRIKFSGSNTGLVPNGGFEVSDALSVTIPSGAAVGVNQWLNCSAGITFFSAAAHKQFLSTERFQFGASITDNTGVPAATANVPAATTYEFYPAAIIAQTTNGALCFIGDSRSNGYSDTAVGTGDIGEFARSVGPSMGYIDLGVTGDKASLQAASFAMRQYLTQYCSHVIIQSGVNDLSTGTSTATQLETSINSLVSYVSQQSPVWVATVPPETTTSDAWATPTPAASSPNNQTSGGAWNTGARVTYNTDLRNLSNFPGIAGYIDITSAVESAWNSGYWQGPAITADGTHESLYGNNVITASHVVPVQSFTAPVNPVVVPALAITTMPNTAINITVNFSGTYTGYAPTSLGSAVWGGGCSGAATITSYVSINGTFTATATTPTAIGSGCTLTVTGAGLNAQTATSPAVTVYTTPTIAISTLNAAPYSWYTQVTGTWNSLPPTSLTGTYGGGCSGTMTLQGTLQTTGTSGSGTFSAVVTTPASSCTGTLALTGTGYNTGTATSGSTAFTTTYAGPADEVASGTILEVYSLRCPTTASATGSTAVVDYKNQVTSATGTFNCLSTGLFDMASATTANALDTSGTGSISGTTLTFTGGHLYDDVTGSGVTPGTFITGGSSPTWTVNNSQTVSSTTLSLYDGINVTKFYGLVNGYAATQATASKQFHLLVRGGGPAAGLPGLGNAGAAYYTSATVPQTNQPFVLNWVAVRTANYTTQRWIMGSASGASAADAFASTANNIRLTVNGGASGATASAADNVWHAVQDTYNGASSVAYVDGTANAVSVSATNGNLGTTVQIGSSANSASAFTGTATEFIYLTAAQPNGNRQLLCLNQSSASYGWNLGLTCN